MFDNKSGMFFSSLNRATEKLKAGLSLVVVFVILLVGTLVTTASFKSEIVLQSPASSVVQNQTPRAEVRDTDWESSFFLALAERTRIVNLPSLKPVVLKSDEVELRLWYDARPDIINGFVIRRSANAWSAFGIRQVKDRWPSPVKQELLGSPKSGWNTLWKRLTEAGILVLPDSDETKCGPAVLDGGGFVVEVIAQEKYRTYRYANPQFADCDEAKRIVSIENTISEEFSLSSTKPSKR
jgi:hypothetical protein